MREKLRREERNGPFAYMVQALQEIIAGAQALRVAREPAAQARFADQQ